MPSMQDLQRAMAAGQPKPVDIIEGTPEELERLARDQLRNAGIGMQQGDVTNSTLFVISATLLVSLAEQRRARPRIQKALPGEISSLTKGGG